MACHGDIGIQALWYGFSRIAKVDKIYVYDLSIVVTSVLVTDVEGLCW